MNETDKDIQNTPGEAIESVDSDSNLLYTTSSFQARKFSTHLRRLIITAIFLALALTVRQFARMYIPLFGVDAMRIGFAGIFTRMPAILFGPLWGGLISGLNDVLGFLLVPSPSGGAYLPHLTVTAASGGFICGGIWLLLRNRNPGNIRWVMLIVSICAILFGAINFAVFRFDGVQQGFFADAYNAGNYDIDTSSMWVTTRLIVERAQVSINPDNMLSTMLVSFTTAPFFAGLLGVMLWGVDLLMSYALKRQYPDYKSVMPLLIAMLVAAWWQSTTNTIVFRHTIWSEALRDLPFVTVWLPRILQSTITTIIYTYAVAVMVEIARRIKWLRPYMR